MKATVKLWIWMAVGLLGGAGAGKALSSRAKTRLASVVSGDTGEKTGARGQGELEAEAQTGVGSPVFPGAASEEAFEKLGFDRQKEMLEKISQRLGKKSPPALELWVARMVSGLSVQQVSALLEALPTEPSNGRGGAGQGGASYVRWVLAQKLATEDAAYSLELGKKLKDELLMGSAVAVVAHRNGADALKIVAGLPDEQREGVLSAMESAGVEKVGGGVRELFEVLRENKNSAAGLFHLGGVGGSVTRFLGAALAGSALNNPAEAMEQFKELSAFLEENVSPDTGGESARKRGGGGRRSGNFGSPEGWVLQNTLSQMRSVSPEAASAFFDSMGENVRSPWMFSDEAISRFRRSGVDAAMSFAEAQNDPEALRSAALGTWWILAQRDRAGAVQWIESLPEGTFRQGVLTAVMVDAWNESRTWGSSQTAIEAGGKLASRASQLDYYAALMADRPERSYSQRMAKSEMISLLPLSDAEKAELYRRVAPIKAP